MKKKTVLAVLLLGTVLCIPGCGFSEGAGATVTIVEATPTPEPTPTPEVTPTPEATPTPEVVTTQTASGVVVTKQDGVYVTTTDINLRADCSTDADIVGTAVLGTELTSTGVCENGWIEVLYDGVTAYCSGDFVTKSEAAVVETTAADASTAETTAAADVLSDGTTGA